MREKVDLGRSAFAAHAAMVVASLLRHGCLSAEGRMLSPDGIRLRSGRLEGKRVPLPDADSKDPLSRIHLFSLLELTTPGTDGAFLTSSDWADRDGNGGKWNVEGPLPQAYSFTFPVPDSGPSIGSGLDYQLHVWALFLDAIELLEGNTRLPEPTHLHNALGDHHIPHRSPLDPEILGERLEGDVYPLYAVAQSEPAIVTLALQWRLLRSSLTLSVDLTTFTLRDNRAWIVPQGGDPTAVYEHLARICNVSCKFCYLFGNPDGIAIGRARKIVSDAELQTRLQHFNPDQERGVFQAIWEINEFLVDPKLPELLRTLRSRTHRPFFFITNGSPLKPEVIDLLAEVKPVQLIVSTNAVEPLLRGAVMGETKEQTTTALGCFDQLLDREIPFGISLIAFPEIPLADLEKTILQLDKIDIAFIRVNLPGFTRSHPFQPSEALSPFWRETVEWVQRLRSHVSSPIMTIPSAYEQNVVMGQPLSPLVLGTIRGSPAARSGLRPGDQVRSFNRRSVTCRQELRALTLLTEGPIELVVDRQGQTEKLVIDTRMPVTYPFVSSDFGKYEFPQGLVCAPELDPRDCEIIAENLEEHSGTGWILTSRIMESAGRELVRRWIPHLEERLEFVSVQNEFLGGNIQIMDMATASDLIVTLRAHLAERPRPRTIFLPSTGFNVMGRDLAGAHWQALERELEIPVRLLTYTDAFPF